MRIEVIQQDKGINGEREVWLRVLSSELLDWPRVKAALAPDHLSEIGVNAVPAGYYPGRPDTAEQAEGFLYEDFWTFRKGKQ